MTIGEEKDISEYNGTLLQRIQDAFDYQEKMRRAQRGNLQQRPARNQGDEPMDIDNVDEPKGNLHLDTQSSFADLD